MMSDNMTITYINAMGGCKSQALNRITKRIWLWAIESHNWLSAAHKPGQLNVTADGLSQHFEDGNEWQFNSQLFDKLCQALGNPQVDLFASQINHLIPMYASWNRDLAAMKKILIWCFFEDMFPVEKLNDKPLINLQDLSD